MTAVVRWHVMMLEVPPFGRQRSADTLSRIFEAGARWESCPPEEIAYARRSMMRMPDHVFVDVVKLIATGECVSPTILQALGRTPKIRDRMKKVGFIPLPPDDPRRYYQSRPTRSREVLAKFGIEVQKPREIPKSRKDIKPQKGAARIPRSVDIGLASGREIRLNRAALFERVWSEPVEKLAKGWGLSGRGLAKACHRLRIPVPPRGFWAKVQHGGQQMRRPRLPDLQPGEAEEIVIHAPCA